jgi:3-methyladenine DNA glycosylase AlkC/predicted GIY-YIG superfamily endonuclease
VAEPLKNIYTREYVERLATELIAAGGELVEDDFCSAAMGDGWESLELKERTTRLRKCLYEFLPSTYQDALPIILKAANTFGGYQGMFFPEYVEAYGLDHWEDSMAALEVLTIYSSAEFAIRAFLEKDPLRAQQQMLLWSEHDNEHIRRLSSEGIRPRLPWASQLIYFKKDPYPVLKILENLNKDESLYVRKSVANNLNDISKDHPELAIKTAKKWIKSKQPHTQWIVKHGLRTLLKAGEPSALKIFGHEGSDSFECEAFELKQKSVSFGEGLSFDFTIDIRKQGPFRFEYALYFLKKNGTHTRKVFKIAEKELEAGVYEIDKVHPFKKINTRVHYEGLHFVEPIVNGVSCGKKPFFLWLKKPDYMVYMLLTVKNTIYTGITTDINRRFDEHLSGVKGAKYTKANAPKELLYIEAAENRSEAQKREAAIKKLSRSKKEAMSLLK